MAAADCTRKKCRGSKRGYRIDKPCGWCGVVMTLKPAIARKRACCSVACGQKLRAQKEGRRPGKPNTFYCAGCHALTVRKVRSGKDDGKYCSRECYTAKKVRVGGEKEALHRIAANWRIKAEPKPAHGPGAIVPCIVCGAEFPKPAFMWPHRALCSDGCRDAHASNLRAEYKKTDKALSLRRTHRAKRRARERGIGADRIDPFKVFDRDGWRCHMCGVKTPKRLRGTLDPLAPELDHIIPLARGGTHTWGNVACACKRCNAIKSDHPLGQLGMPFAA